jgi:hypothetical protein
MYLRNPIQSQTYKDIEVDQMYLRPIQSQTYKDIAFHLLLCSCMFVIVLEYVNTCDLLLCPCMFVIILDYVNTCDLLLCPCMFVIVLDYVNTCLYSMSLDVCYWITCIYVIQYNHKHTRT